MRFCERCHSYMRGTRGGFACSRCGHIVQTETIEVKKIRQQAVSPIDVIEGSDVEGKKTRKTCPKCDNPKAFRSLFFFSGEHAGVRQERSIERFTCTKCGHAWTVS